MNESVAKWYTMNLAFQKSAFFEYFSITFSQSARPTFEDTSCFWRSTLFPCKTYCLFFIYVYLISKCYKNSSTNIVQWHENVKWSKILIHLGKIRSVCMVGKHLHITWRRWLIFIPNLHPVFEQQNVWKHSFQNVAFLIDICVYVF